MAYQAFSISPTPLPRFDTLNEHHQPAPSGDSHRHQRYQRRQFSYADNAAAQPKGKTPLLKSFSRFITSFTGESEVCFKYSLRTCLGSPAKPEVVQASLAYAENVPVGEASTRNEDYPLKIRQSEDVDQGFGFGLEILADLEDFDSVFILPVLDQPLVVQYHVTQMTLVFLYDSSYLPDDFASVAWSVLCRQLSRSHVSETEVALSVLNHPPLQIPPPVHQIEEGRGATNLLHAGFEKAVARFSSRHALHFSSVSVGAESRDHVSTYAELDDLTTALALELRDRLSARQGQIIVPAHMSNSTEFYVSWLAVLKAGLAFCPLPTDAPAEQLRGIVEETAASLILTNGTQIGGRPWDAWYCDYDELTTCLDVQDFIKRYQRPSQSRNYALPQVQPSDLAYVMYTSGSTGKPKGVRIHHSAAACSIASHTKFVPHGFTKDGFRWFQFAAPTFDPSIMEIFTTWWTGGTLCSAPRDLLLTDPEAVINKLSATIMMATPSMASVLRPEKVPTLRHLWTMGEKLTPKVIQNFASDAPHNVPSESHTPCLQRSRRLLNAYGPTEASINCTIVADVSVNERGSVIGQPIDTCSILIIDPDQPDPTPVPLGFSGELAIGGPQVSHGYLNRPQQTAASFASISKYGKLYRTGDRARVVKTGTGKLTVDYLGRMTTDQVKLSGRRVELGQIESTISRVSGVANAVAIVHQHGAAGAGSEQIVACVVADGSQSQEDILAECRRAAEASLAQFMQPSKHFVLESLPRSRNGKTDRKALGAIVDEMWDTSSISAASSDSGYDSALAQSFVDETTCKNIISTIAHICDIPAEGISLGAPLLSLGLDSLRVVRLLQQLRDKGIAHLTVAAVLTSQTVRGLVERCATSEQSAGKEASPNADGVQRKLKNFNDGHLETVARDFGLKIADIEKVLPTTATQSGMIASFLRSTSHPDSRDVRKQYINHSIYHAESAADITRLTQAWRDVLQRHDILRTIFSQVDDDMAPFCQCILSPSAAAAATKVRRFECRSEEAWDDIVVSTKVQAEQWISLSRPAHVLSIIQGPDRVAYILSLFHGIFDGGSLELIVQDVEDAYAGREPAPRNSIEIAVRKHFSEATAETAKYWQETFKDFEVAPFPCVSASKPETQISEAQVTEVIATTTLQQVVEASKQMSVSPLSMLQAAWGTILFAYTGSTSEVSFGSVVSNRLEEDLSSCVGPTFVVVPCKISQNDVRQRKVNEAVQHLTSRKAEDLPYHHIPLGGLTTSEGTLPYDTLLAFQAFDKSAAQSSVWQKVEYPPMEHDFAVMIEIWPTREGPLRLRATYTAEHLDHLAGQTMLKQLDQVIGFFCQQPEKPFLDARFAVGEDLRSEIPVQSTADEDDAGLVLHHTFKKHVSERTDHPAVFFKQSMDGSLPDIQWTFGELYRLASTLATKLVSKSGTLHNQPVMLCMEKCPELYVAVLGVLLAGAGWCPIDPYSPPARQHAIMERTGSKLLLLSATASNVDQAAIPQGVQTLKVDIAELESQPEQGAPAVNHQPSDLAYLIFTSGTTGLPKGVPITHKSAATAMNALAEAVPHDVTGAEVRCMQFSQYTFDVFVQDLFYTWTLGGTVISGTREIMIQNFADLANETKATHAHLTPAFSATLQRNKVKTLEVVTMIGEKLTEAVANDWGADMRAFNTYGPAETTVVSTLRQFTGKNDRYHASNIGVPLPSVGTYVVDNGNVVMRGAIGELGLSGPQLSPGYWNMPEVNAKKFVWNEALQQKLYLTGDLVRHLADGSINFVGRDDDLVKLGGIRVELGEIAFALRDADPKIEKFEVLHLQRKGGNEKSVVAFMACPSLADESGDVMMIDSPAAKELAQVARAHAETVLPANMIPATFVVLPRIPRTASAKVDRAALTAIYHALDLAKWSQAAADQTTAQGDAHAQWRQQHEKLLGVIAGEVRLDVSSLQPTSSLPAIGMDSIGAIRLILKINALGYNMSVVDAFKCRTLADLCRLVEASSAPKASAVDNSGHAERILQSLDAKYYQAVSKYLDETDVVVIPTTVLQESLLSESFKDAQAYWSSHLFELDERVDLSKLKRAWTKVARQTDALRAGFVAKAALGVDSDDHLSYLQVIYDEPEFKWQEHKSLAAIDDAAKQRVQEIAEHHHKLLFKLPPWAVDILVAKDDKRVMMVTIHHTIYDGPSLDFIMADVQAAYQRANKVTERLSLRNAIAANSAHDADNQGCVSFWKKSLQDIADTSEENPSAQNDDQLKHRIRYLRSSISLDDLRRLATGLGLSSLVTVYRAAWALILTDLLETKQILFAEILSDRAFGDKVANVIGPMMSTVPCLFKRGETVSETLHEHDTFSKQAWEHRNVRPGTIKSILGRGASSQIYPAVFAFHPAGSDEESAADMLWKRMEDVTSIQVEHPFAFNVWQHLEKNPMFELAVPEHMMSADEQDLLLQQLDALIAAMVKRPQTVMHSLTDGFDAKLISRTTPRQNTGCPSPHSPTYWVEHWAETRPDWKGAEIALKIDIDGTKTESWTYAQLDQEANRIANWILASGVNKRMIGMCLGRTLSSYAVVLGILKSGNCYLPIDDSLPAERKSFLLADSDSALFFTTQALAVDVVIPEGCQLIDVETLDLAKKVSAMNSERPAIDADPRDNCYLLYTSGSTGKPKGVLVNRQNLASFVEAQNEFICACTSTKDTAGKGAYLGLASRAFDVHLGEMFLAWRFGCAAVTAPRSMLLDDLALALESLHITHASFVPSLLDQTGLTPEDAPDLVFLGVGGEKMSPKTKKLWGSHDRVGLINAYGPTEATIGCCSGRLFPGSDMRDIGSPLGDSQAHLLMPGSDHYVLRGMPGELCFTGSLIANGYLNRPDAKGFVENFNGTRMYRTGDIVKLGLDDHIYFLGRKDDQVKIRGQRVELGEVAEGVRTASSVDIDTAALVLQHPGLARKQLVAFIAPAKSSRSKSQHAPEVVMAELQETNNKLRAQCQKSLPSSLVPDLIVPLNFIPLAATSGKADNKLLTKIFSDVDINELMPTGQGGGQSQTTIARPLNDIETEVWNIISPILKEQPKAAVMPSTSLFELGIDSLSGISAFSKLRAAGFECSVSMVMKNPTLAELSQSRRRQPAEDEQRLSQVREKLSKIKADFLQQDLLPIERGMIAAVRPCLPLQEVLIAQSMHQGQGGLTGAYVNHVMFRLDAEVDLKKVRQAWTTLIGENDILRTCFSTTADEFLQIVLEQEACQNVWTEASSLQDQTIETFQGRVASEVVESLQTRPPIRLHHFSDDGTEVLMLSIHHALYDGNSLEMMFHDVRRLYNDGKPESRLNVVPLLEYIVAQDESRLKLYWTQQLQDWESAALFTSESSKGTSLAEAERQFSKTISELESIASSLQVTVATLMQAAYAVSMSQKLNTNDLIFGNVLSGRSIPVPDADKIMAPCITTIPQRAKFDNPSATFVDFLRALQNSNSSSLEYQHVSPRSIQRWIGADRALYDVLFSFIRIQASNEEEENNLLKPEASDIRVDYPLAVEFEANANTDKLTVRAGFTEAFGSTADADMLLEKIELLIDVLIQDKDLTIEKLGISSSGRAAQNQKPKYDESSWSAEEKEVRRLISEFTSVPVEQIRKDTAFIHLGIDSISAIRFAKVLRTNGFKLSSADVIRHNRLGALCEHHYSAKSSDSTQIGITASEDLSSSDLTAILKFEDVAGITDETQCYECTPLQSGMLAQSLATDGALYMHHHAVHLAPDVDLSTLKSSWESLVRDLDVLRTTFHWLPKQKTPWIAAVHRDRTPSWREVKAADPRQYWLQLSEMSEFMQRIEAGQPLANVDIVRSDKDVVLVLSLHHAIYDGISLGLLYDQWEKRYLGEVPAPTTPFFAAAGTITANAMPAVKYWVDLLDDYQGISTTASLEASSFQLLEQTVTSDMSAFDAQARAADMDIKDVCVAAFGKALARIHQRRDTVFGQVVAARHSNIGNGNDIVGPMFNTVPIRVTIRDQLVTNEALIRAVHEVNAGSIEYQHAPLAEVQKAWRASTTNTSMQLLDSIFVYSKIEKQDSESKIFGKPLEADKSPVPSEYRINFEVEHSKDGIVARILTSISGAEAQTLLEHFSGAIHDFVEQPSRYATAFPSQLRFLPVAIEMAAVSVDTFDEDAVSRYAAPIRKAMAEVSQVPEGKIALDSSIYTFGIDSIAAIQIVSRCRNCGVRLGVADILKGAMLGRICEIVFERQGNAEKSSTQANHELVPQQDRQAALQILDTPGGSIEDVLPCLPGQEYHLSSWLQSGRTLYEPGWCYQASSRLDSDRLKAAWQVLRNRNQVLRTTIAAIDKNKALQVILKPEAISSDAFEVVEAGDFALIDAVKRRAHLETRQPSDFLQLPVRLRLIKSKDKDAIMLYVHHALYDAWSMPRLVSELQNIYQEQNLDGTAPFSELVRHVVASVDKDEEQRFWQEALSGCDKAIVPSKSQPQDDLDRRQSFFMTEGSNISIQDLEQVCAKHNISAHHLVLLAFARALATTTGTSSPLFGFFQLGRSASFEGIEKVTGPCVNALPLGLRSVLGTDIKQAINRLQQILGSRVPFEQSSLRTAVRAFDSSATQIPFNAYVNLLWHKTGQSSSDDLFQPMQLGVPTDYSSPRALPGKTAVDALDTNFLPPQQIFVDIGPGENGILFGVRADAALMDDEGIKAFVGKIEAQVGQCLKELDC